MTFLTLCNGPGKKPVVVLGFTRPGWRTKVLKKWATENRENDIKAYRDLPCIARRYNAFQATHDAGWQMQENWTPSKCAHWINNFRERNNLGLYSQGLRGLAFAIPYLESETRCPICLCSTDFRIVAEDDRAREDFVRKHKIRTPANCAEVEGAIVIEELEQTARGLMERLTKKVSGAKGTLRAMGSRFLTRLKI